MNTDIDFEHQNYFHHEIEPKDDSPLRFSISNERKLLKVILLGYLHKLFCEIFQKLIQFYNNSLECYAMDSKIIQILIQDIIETGDYTLEGIAYHTRIPFDIIYDAACGINNQLSITPWVRIVDLYMRIKPDIEKILLEKLLEMKSKNDSAFSLLLTEI